MEIVRQNGIRYLVVVFTVRRKTVTAYEMDAAERRKYAPQID